MSDFLKLNKSDKTIYTDDIKGGIKKSDIQNEFFKSLFDRINTNKSTAENGEEYLDADEIKNFIDKLIQISGKDKKLGKTDMKKVKEALGLENVKDFTQEQLFSFLDVLINASEDIAESTVTYNENGERVINIKRNETTTNNDGSYTTEETQDVIQENGQISRITTTNDYDANNQITGSIVQYPGGNFTSINYSNGIITEEMNYDSGKNSTTTIKYSDGTPDTKTIVNGNKSESYEYVNGEWRLTQKILNEGKPNQKSISYIYNEDGTVETSCKYNDVKNYNRETTVTTLYSDNTLSKKLTQTIDAEGQILTAEFYDDGSYTEYSETSESTFTADHKTLSKTITINDREYTANYNENGTIYVVQFRDTAEKIAEKSGCTVDELFAANEGLYTGSGASRRFKAGTEITIPKIIEPSHILIRNMLPKSRVDAIVATSAANTAMAQEKINAMGTLTVGEFLEEVGFTKDCVIKSAKDLAILMYKLDFVVQEHGARYSELTVEEFNDIVPPAITEEELNVRAAKIAEMNPEIFNSDGSLKQSKTKVYDWTQGFVNVDGRILSHLKDVKFPVDEALAEFYGVEKTLNDNLDQRFENSRNYKTGSEIETAIYEAYCRPGFTNKTDKDAIDSAFAKITPENVSSVIIKSANANRDKTLIRALSDESDISDQEAKNYANKLFENLVKRAEALGMEYSKFQEKYNSLSDFQKIDNLLIDFAREIFAIENSTNRDEVLSAELEDEMVDNIVTLGENNANEANKIIDEQIKNNGFFEDCYNVLKIITDSPNTTQRALNEVAEFREKLKALETAYNEQGTEGFKTEFRKLFNKDFNATTFSAYTTYLKQYAAAVTRDNLKKIDTNTATENELVNILSETFPLPENSETKYTDYDKATLVKLIQEGIYELNIAAGGASTNELSRNIENTARTIFGSEFDVVQKAMTYSISQQKGGAYVEMGAKMLATIAVGMSTGGLGVAASTAAVFSTNLAIHAVDESWNIAVNGGTLTSEEAWDIVKNCAIDSALYGSGMKYAKMVDEMAQLTRLQQMGRLVAFDTSTGVVGDYIRTGEVTIDGVFYNLVFSAAGNCVGLIQGKKLNGGSEKITSGEILVDPSTTPTLTKAVKNPSTETGIAPNSNVIVGNKKAKVITGEIDDIVSRADTNLDDLIRARNELESIANRDLRREAIRKLDERVSKLSPEEQLAYQKALTENLRTRIDHVINTNRFFQSSDVRVLREYVNNIEDIGVLKNLREQLLNKQQKMRDFGSKNYDNAFKAIDDKIKKLESSPSTPEAPRTTETSSTETPVQRADIEVIEPPITPSPRAHAIANEAFNTAYSNSQLIKTTSTEIGGRIGLEKFQNLRKEFEELARLAKTPDELDMLQNLANKFRNPAHREAFLEPINNRRQQLSVENPNEFYVDPHHIILNDAPANNGITVEPMAGRNNTPEAPRTAETPSTETPVQRAETPVQRPEAPIEPNPRTDAQTPPKQGYDLEITPDGFRIPDLENILKNISDAEIPAEHINLWNQCKESINNLTGEIREAAGNITGAITNKCKGIINDLNRIALYASASVKRKIEELIDNLRKLVAKKDTTPETPRTKTTVEEPTTRNTGSSTHTETSTTVIAGTKFEEFCSLVRQAETTAEIFQATDGTIIARIKNGNMISSNYTCYIFDNDEQLSRIITDVDSNSFRSSFSDYTSKGTVHDTSGTLNMGFNFKNIFRNAFDNSNLNVKVVELPEQYTYFNNNSFHVKDCNLTVKIGNTEVDLSKYSSKLNSLQVGEEFTIGRKIGNDIRFENDALMSGYHLRIQRTKDGFEIIDISTNGTRIKANPKTPKIPIMNNLGDSYIPLTKEQPVIITDLDVMLKLGSNSTIDLSKYADNLYSLPDGTIVTIGRSEHNFIELSDETVSRTHLTIEKTPEGFKITDQSSNGTQIKSNKNLSPIEQAYNKFNREQAPINLPNSGRLDSNAQYILDKNSLPVFEINGKNGKYIIDLNSSEYKSSILNLQEGQYLTIGREGTITIAPYDNVVSRQHIVITRHNGKLQIKDLSKYGTYMHQPRRTSSGSRPSQAQERPVKPSKNYKTGNNTYAEKFIADVEYYLNKLAGKTNIENLSHNEKKEIADLLEISTEELNTLISKDDAAKLYRKLMLRWHSDRNPNDEVAGMISQLINAIYS